MTPQQLTETFGPGFSLALGCRFPGSQTAPLCLELTGSYFFAGCSGRLTHFQYFRTQPGSRPKCASSLEQAPAGPSCLLPMLHHDLMSGTRSPSSVETSRSWLSEPTLPRASHASRCRALSRRPATAPSAITKGMAPPLGCESHDIGCAFWLCAYGVKLVSLDPALYC